MNNLISAAIFYRLSQIRGAIAQPLSERDERDRSEGVAALVVWVAIILIVAYCAAHY
jgi:hypothetical protein